MHKSLFKLDNILAAQLQNTEKHAKICKCHFRLFQYSLDVIIDCKRGKLNVISFGFKLLVDKQLKNGSTDFPESALKTNLILAGLQ